MWISVINDTLAIFFKNVYKIHTSLSPGVCSYEFDDFLSIGANSGASGVQSPVTDNRTLSFIAAVKLTCQHEYWKNNSRKIIKMTA